MKKQIISVILTLAMITALVPMMSISASAEDAIELKLGDYVQMGSYDGSPILWRCVSFDKITGYDDDGNPIVDSTKTKTEYESGYLPLMLCDDALCQKEFDVAGSNTIGSHGRGGYCTNPNEYYYGSMRRRRGSNYWGDSNLRCWLNSEAGEGEVIYTCGNPPAWYNASNSTVSESGFLSNFSLFERNTIKKVSQATTITKSEYNQSMGTNGSGNEFFVDKIFLPDLSQYNSTKTNFGDYCYLTKYGYWLRMASERRYSWGVSGYCNATEVKYVDCGNYVSDIDAYSTGVNSYFLAVRPAFYLDYPTVQLKSEGSVLKPYRIRAIDGFSLENISFGVHLEKSDYNGYVVATLFNKDNQLVNMKKYPAAENVKVSFDLYDTGCFAKIFWWDGLETLKPLGKAQSLEVVTE